MTNSRITVCTALLAAASAMACVHAAENTIIPTYTATYQVEYNGRRAGSSEFSVSFNEATGIYRFESHTTARGLYRLVSPNPIIERSDFVVENGEIIPLNFWFQDGSRRTRSLHIAFDWSNRVATIDDGNSTSTVELRDGVLDRGSMQIALMLDMARSKPTEYLLADDDGDLRPYRYVPAGEESVTTPAGTHDAAVFRQQREGSSRAILVWAAPALAYLPVRIEQQRDGDTRTALLLESVQGLDNP
jgi:hypothetical protein